MNAFGARVSEVFGWVLQTTWQAAVLAGLILLAQLLFRKQLSPAWRYGLWLLLLVRLLVPVPPQSALSIFNLARLEPLRSGAATAALSPSTSPLATTAAVETSRRAALSAANASEFQATTGLGDSQVVLESPVQGLRPRPAANWFGLAVWVWFVGACLCGLRLVWSDLRFRSRLAGYVPVADENVTRHFEECLATLGICERVTLIETEEVDSPAVYGLWRKRLLLPDGSFDRFTVGELRCILLHELAHLKRHDLEINWLVSVVQALHWFNPVLWLAFARMRADREIACDALALDRMEQGEGLQYGETVLKLLEGLVRPAAIPGLVGISEDKSRMKQRIRMIAAFKRPGRWSGMAALLVAALGIVGLTDASQAIPATRRKIVERSSAIPETDDRFWMEAKINGKPARLFLDTGLESFCLYRPAAERLGLNLRRVDSLFLYSRGQKPYWVTEECSVSLWGLSRKAAFAIYEVPSYLPPGEGDGMVGWHNVDENIIEFDAVERKVRFIDQVPKEAAGWTTLSLRTNLPWGSRGLVLEAPGRDGGKSVIFIGTGLKGGGVWLSPQRWREWKAAHTNQPTTLIAGHNQLAGSMVRERAWAKELSVGPLELTDVVVEEAVPVPASLGLAPTENVASFGMAALRRLDLIVDGKNAVAYLRPKKTPASPPAYQPDGPSAAFAPHDEKGDDLVAHVANASPAYTAGIRDGDVLLKIGQRDASKWRADPEFPRLIFPRSPSHSATGTKLELTLKRGDETLTTSADEQEIGIYAPPPDINSSVQGSK